MSSRSIPEEAIEEILSRLPARTLIRFRRVCKPWLHLLTNPTFIQHHLNKVKTNPIPNSSLILDTTLPENSMLTLHVHDRLASPALLHHPFPARSTLVSSVDGLVCLCHDDQFILWNPATKLYKCVLDPIIHAGASFTRRVAVGFGHDPVRNDYSVVSVLKNPQLVQVYSLNLNTWREIGTQVDVLRASDSWWRESQAVVNGVFYWIVTTTNRRGWDVCLFSFDLCNEAIRRARLPDIGDILGSDVVLGDHKESLALIKHCRDENCFDLWVMDDCDGGEDAWSKKYTFIPILPVEEGDLIGCLMNGEIVFRDKKDTLFLFNTENPETWILSLDGVVIAILDCTESLLHIKGAKQLETDAAGKGNRMRYSHYVPCNQFTSYNNECVAFEASLIYIFVVVLMLL
ncbi:hypothetical protein RJ640_021613 [Escallonia rubra]|uniref:F-box domain-containing protein n=1 Tax=Escallonia rubra TaxID=112253 RepID=A0AA88RDP5_9ASTE|nr:hypothetical protein RJ640_021613 [Escallonia rubra]